MGAAPPIEVNGNSKYGQMLDPYFGILLMERILHHRINFCRRRAFPLQFSAAVPGVRPRARLLPLSIPGFNVAFFEGKAGWTFCFTGARPFPAGRPAQGATHDAFQY